VQLDTPAKGVPKRDSAPAHQYSAWVL